MATGHGGLTTLHAESLDYAVKRLTSAPMDVAKPYIPLINVAPLVERVQLLSPDNNVRFGRRITVLNEIVDFEQYKTISQWNPITDKFDVHLENSELLKKIAEKHGVTLQEIYDEIKNRVVFLQDLRAKKITKNTEFKKLTTNYYNQAKNKKDQKVLEAVVEEKK